MNYEIKERLTNEELIKNLKNLTAVHGSKFYKHSNGDSYYTGEAVTININGTSYWGIAYYPVDPELEEPIYEILHTRPLYEFLDGRFTIIK